MDRQHVAARHPRRQRHDLGQDAAPDQLGPYPASRLAVRHGRGQHQHRTAAGRGVRVRVLEPGEFALGPRGDAQLPAGVQEQVLPAPVRHGHRRVADDQIGSELRPAVLAQGVAAADVGPGAAGQPGPQPGELRHRRVDLLPVPDRPRRRADRQQQGADPAGRVEDGRVLRHVTGEVPHRLHDPRGGDLVRARAAGGLREALGQAVDQLGGGAGGRDLGRPPGEVRAQPRRRPPVGELPRDGRQPAHEVVAVHPAQQLPQLGLAGGLPALVLAGEPVAHLGEPEERAARTAAGRCGEVVVAAPPVGDGGSRHPGHPGDLGACDQRISG